MVDMNRFENDIYGVKNFWNDLMPTMTCEECGELIQAISKFLRASRMYACEENPYNERLGETVKHMIEEIGDMYICLAALQKYFNISDEDVYGRIEEKLNKKY